MDACFKLCTIGTSDNPTIFDHSLMTLVGASASAGLEPVFSWKSPIVLLILRL